MPRAKLRRLPALDALFEPAGVDHLIRSELPSGRPVTRSYLVARPGRLDSDEQDELLIELLRLQIVQVDRRLRAERAVASLLALIDAGLDGGRQGVVLPASGGHVVLMSQVARRLLHHYFGWRAGPRLPRRIASWLEAPDRRDQSLRLLGPTGTTLVVAATELPDRRAALLLYEEGGHVGKLSPREREVLELVTEGLTNAQIAERLWIAKGTVRKHLENAFAKLGVSTRTAAVAALAGSANR